jgi:NADPH:quinone reductase-like Zn-dependent oxidoreductase
MSTPTTNQTSIGTMRAVVHDAYGTADVLRATTTRMPTIGDDEVLVRVRAAGLDRGTWHVMSGKPYLLRVLGFGFRRPKDRVPGRGLAGTVAAVGANVTRFAPGDEVYGVARGTFAEYAATRPDLLAPKPAALSFGEAAAVPISATTALQALADVGRLAPGQEVLITGASGGVGSFAVQLAKSFGAEVTGVCSTQKLDLVRSLGADRVIDHTREDFADDAGRYDLIIDLGGRPALSRLRRALKRNGTAVIVGGEGGDWTGGFGRTLRAPLLSPFVSQRLTMLTSKERGSDLDRLNPLLEDGTVRPHLDSTYPLDRAAEAMRRLESGAVQGKVAIVVGP